MTPLSPAALVVAAGVLGTLTDAARQPPAKKGPSPKLTVAVPLTVEPGKPVKLTVRGLNLDGVSEVRVHEPKSRAKLLGPAKKAGVPQNAPAERIGDMTVEVELTPAKELPAGTLALSVVGPGGESNPVKVAVADDTPRIAEKEPNDGLPNAQPVVLPCVIEGAIGRERDVDVFRFEGKAGDVVKIDVQAAKLGSPLDSLVTVFDAAGRIVASEDDTAGSPDPTFAVTLPKAGTYFVSLIDANDLGGPAFAYRLRLGK